jgi:adenosylcobinamide kinase/adenosylcobinamide-phosphate guanylyltransferase
VTGKQLILVGGGTRSGKSDFALAVARSLGQKRLFVATAQACDDEMTARIHQHRATRGDEFETVEEPLALADLLTRTSTHDVVVVDCLTLWIANLLLAGNDAKAAQRHISELAEVLKKRLAHIVIVTSEVGLGLVPETALGRDFRDVVGIAHQCIADLADEVYFGVLGVMLRLKPGSIAAVNRERFS